jgi:hypothetical protein
LSSFEEEGIEGSDVDCFSSSGMIGKRRKERRMFGSGGEQRIE